MLRIRPNATLVSSLFTVWEICWGLFTKSGWALLTWKKDGGQIAPNNLLSSGFWTSWCRICEMWWDIMSSHRWHLSQSCPLNVGLRQSLGNTSQTIQRHGVQASQERLSMTYHCSLWATEFRDVLPSYFVVAYVFKPISLAVLCRGQCFSVICCSIWAPFPWRHSFSSLSPSLPTFPFLPIQYFLPTSLFVSLVPLAHSVIESHTAACCSGLANTAKKGCSLHHAPAVWEGPAQAVNCHILFF